MNNDTHNYYMVLVRPDNGLQTDAISDTIFSNKAKARKEYRAWNRSRKYFVEVLHYTGTPDDNLRNFWGTIIL